MHYDLEIFTIGQWPSMLFHPTQPRASARRCTSNSTTFRCGHTRTTQPTAPARARASTSSDAKLSGTKATAEGDKEDEDCAKADTADDNAGDGGASDDVAAGIVAAFATGTVAAFTTGIELAFATGIEPALTKDIVAAFTTGIEPAANTEATRNGLRCGAIKGSCSEISSHWPARSSSPRTAA